MTDEEKIWGQVKWFDATKGFGFVVADEGGPDILLHANVLRNFGQSSIADGSVVYIAVQATERGKQATEVFEISAPRDAEGGAEPATSPELPADLSDVPLEPARVKWFDKIKGFGFANVYGRPEDVFIHMEVLRSCGMADLIPGEAICIRVIEGPRGQMAGEVRSWEFGQKEAEK
ncbi:cold-shock protein [Maritimibacter sp. 55A14]|uniref:cold-shock protein n=1 Tax=Maritimibacter sp. 55A14 TaxID=2174844 RepID=UPI000D619B18|nr:cold shock protein [Maritimibacter sp. 55A14]PWE33080.1 cold-shock protein [Maritimibacter sp. 55A14]